jgi:uncharacterized membrane protein YjjP (DUF1212 family)
MPSRAAKGNRMENAKTREIYKENFAEYLLCLAMDIGEGMLKCGAEVSRVEDTIERVCRAYGAAHVEVFSIISVINATVRMPDGTFSSQMRRVRSSGYDLTMLEKYNALSREVCRDTPTLDEFDAEIHKIRSSVTYRWWVQMIALMSICSGFTFFFGGVSALSAASGTSMIAFILVNFVTINFVFELLTNLVLAPAIHRVITIWYKEKH